MSDMFTQAWQINSLGIRLNQIPADTWTSSHLCYTDHHGVHSVQPLYSHIDKLYQKKSITSPDCNLPDEQSLFKLNNRCKIYYLSMIYRFDWCFVVGKKPARAFSL